MKKRISSILEFINNVSKEIVLSSQKLWIFLVSWGLITGFTIATNLGHFLELTIKQELVLLFVLNIIIFIIVFRTIRLSSEVKVLSNPLQWLLIIFILFGIPALLAIVGNLKTNNLWLFSEQMPAIFSFRVLDEHGSFTNYNPGDLVELQQGENWQIEARIEKDSQVSCTWYSEEGEKLTVDACTFEFDRLKNKNNQVIGIRIESPRKTKERIAGLHIRHVTDQP